MNLPILRVVLATMLLSACAAHQPVASPKQSAPIRRLSVQPFEGAGSAEVTREITQALKVAGWTIVDKNQPADAVLIGMVTDYRSNQKLMVFLGETNTLTGTKSVTVSNPVVSMNGSQVLPQGPAISMTNPHVVMERTVVGITARLVTLPKREIVWSDGYSYEGLVLTSARQIVIAALTRSFNSAAPRFQHNVSSRTTH